MVDGVKKRLLKATLTADKIKARTPASDAADPRLARQGGRVVQRPIPEQIAAAKNIFISNMGADPGGLLILMNAIKDRDATYNQFYAALKSWGHFNIVAKPSDADLVFQLGLVDHAQYPARMTLVIYDEQSHYPLWTLSEPLEGAARQATWQKNFSVCVNALIGDLKRIATPQD